MSEPLISIIVPVYKVEKFLEQCVQSVISQTYSNLEIILVDDVSPDRCPQLCDEWSRKDRRIKVIHKQNADCQMQEILGFVRPEGSIWHLWIRMTGFLRI